MVSRAASARTDSGPTVLITTHRWPVRSRFNASVTSAASWSGVATMTITTAAAGALVNRATVRTPAAAARSWAAGNGSTPVTW